MYSVLHLGLSYACNMHCSHCYVKKSNDVYDIDLIRTTIDELEKQGLFIVYYTYGEPLLSEMFWNIAAYLQNRGFVQILMTNGSLLDENNAKRIRDLGISNVYISLDSSNASIHNKNRKHRNAFNLAISALKNCRNQGINVGVSTTVTRQNVYDLDEIYRLAVNENISVISFLRQRTKTGSCRFSSKESEAYIDFFKRVVQDCDKINVKFHDLSLLTTLEELKSSQKISSIVYDKFREMNMCHAHRTLSMAPDGSIRHCNLFGNPIGNIMNEPILDILIKEIENNEDIVCCPTLS